MRFSDAQKARYEAEAERERIQGLRRERVRYIKAGRIVPRKRVTSSSLAAAGYLDAAQAEYDEEQWRKYPAL